MTQSSSCSRGPKKPQIAPSLFNDVVGPIMRGPSSSHTAASVRIGRLALDLMNGDLNRVLIEFHPTGSLATTHEDQGTDMGLFGGLLGWDAKDERLPKSAAAIRDAGIDVEIRLSEFPATHPNTYKMTLSNDRETKEIIALSTGGGMIEVISIDQVPVSFIGDSYVTLLCSDRALDSESIDEMSSTLQERFHDSVVSGHGAASRALFVVQGGSFLNDEEYASLKNAIDLDDVRRLSPVLPILTPKGMTVPFLNSKSMLAYKPDEHRSLADWAISYECQRGGIEKEQVIDQMMEIVILLKASIRQGIAGTSYDDRILGHQCGKFHELMKEGKLLDGGMLNRMILYVSALMEVKSAMGLIVAAPTAGSCGAMPGAVLAATEEMGLTDRDAVDAMLAAGLIGVFIAAHSSFAAEVGGCQAETGAGAAMAAAGLVTLCRGTAKQALGAASMALQNTLGLICDPVANRVEAPCLGRNITAAANAFASTNVSLAHFDALIPLDEVIDTHFQVGNNIPCELRCTALGGLSITPTSQAIAAKLKSRPTVDAS